MDWRKIPFAGRKALLDCIQDTGAEVLVSKGCFFLISSKANKDQTRKVIKKISLEGLDSIGELIHTSSQSYRSIYSFRTENKNGEVYFIKKSVENLYYTGFIISFAARVLKTSVFF